LFHAAMRIDPLFANHLFFMANHRGSVRLEGRDVHVLGPIDELNSFVPGSPRSILPEGCRTVRLAPWSGDWSAALAAAGFRPAEALSYRELADCGRPLSAVRDIEVRVVGDREEAQKFADIQAAGFAAGEPGDAWWSAYFLTQAQRNFDHPGQVFYLGFAGAEPCACTVVCKAAGVAGVYAVATKPHFRRRGASAALLERARRDAVAADWPRLILQAVKGSYAEAYYARLGFFERFASQVWRR
jgi:GNAT superfamily N-acetyltransferase